MRTHPFQALEPGVCAALISAVFCLTVAPAAIAATGEDSLICAKVKDSYAANAYTAAFWPRSQAYGDMSWCNLEVKAIEHCVPVQPILHETTAPYEGYVGPALQAEYTCYRIRCMNGEGSSFMGTTVSLDDTFGPRVAGKPQVTRVCMPDK